MATAGTAYIELRAKLDQFERDLRNAEATALKGGTRIGSSVDTGVRSRLKGLSDFGKRLGRGLALGAGAGLAAVGVAGKAAFEAAQEAAQVGAQTEAVLKSTGGAANVTAKEVEALASRIMAYSAMEDEAIASGANLLLTFTNIRNEAGENNDIFTQGVEIMADMSTALGQDMKASATQLGKALNDPIRGVTALSRVGVTFTEEQKEQIEVLVESGDTMKAQKVILHELTKEFGGSAEAVGKTKAWDKMKNAIGEVLEAIGTALLPTINDLADRLAKFVQSDQFQDWLKTAERWMKKKLPDAIDTLVGAFGEFGEAIQFFKEEWARIQESWRKTQERWGDFLAFFTEGVKGWVEMFFWAADKIVSAAAMAFGWVPGVGDKLKRARDDFREYSDGIINDLESQIHKFDTFGEASARNVQKVREQIRGLNSLIQTSDFAPGTIRAEMPGGGVGAGNLGSNLISIGHNLQSQGFRVSEHPAFGGVQGGHASGSYHYAGRAIDINWGAPGQSAEEMTVLTGIGKKLAATVPGIKELLGPWNDPKHKDHLHLAMDSGGWVTGPATVHIGNIRERVHFTPEGQGGTTIININGGDIAEVERVVMRVVGARDHSRNRVIRTRANR